MRLAAEAEHERGGPPGPDVETMLAEVTDPALRKILETLYWRK